MKHSVTGVVFLAIVALTAVELMYATDNQQPLTIEVRVCEGTEFKFWFNEQAQERWQSCAKPLQGIPVAIAVAAEKAASVETDSTGRARLGPISVATGQKFRLAVACTSHRCLTLGDLFIGSGVVREGANKLLLFTVPEPPGGTTGPAGNGS